LISRIPVLANGINQIREGFLPFLKSFSNCVLTSLPSISIVLLLGAGGSTPAMSISTSGFPGILVQLMNQLRIIPQ
jgi:hypothetical protein